MDALVVEGALLPLRTAAALLPVLAAGLAFGAVPGPITDAERPVVARLGNRLLLTAFVVGTAAAAGLFLPRALPADAVAPLALATALLPCLVVVCALRVPLAVVVVLGAAAGLLGARAAFARFLPGELPLGALVGAVLGLVAAASLATLLAGVARTLLPGPVTGIGTRVAGSWLAAVALLMLALQLFPA